MTNPTQKTREAQTRSSTVRNADEPALAQLHDGMPGRTPPERPPTPAARAGRRWR